MIISRANCAFLARVRNTPCAYSYYLTHKNSTVVFLSHRRNLMPNLSVIIVRQVCNETMTDVLSIAACLNTPSRKGNSTELTWTIIVSRIPKKSDQWPFYALLLLMPAPRNWNFGSELESYNRFDSIRGRTPILVSGLVSGIAVLSKPVASIVKEHLFSGKN